MPIRHKFYETTFGNGFGTHTAILDITPYKPEVMIVGTFNPNTPNANFADFFYGRNFFWPAFKNLFIDNNIGLVSRRMPSNGTPTAILNPTLDEILKLCIKLKLTFSDLVLEVLHTNNPQYQNLANDNVVLNEQEFNLIQDGRDKGINGLQQLDALGQVHWNTQNIINYLCENPQIRFIYLTRKPTGIWAGQWNLIKNHPCMEGRQLTNIFTPSGAGKPVYRSMARLLHHWLHNNRPNFGRLDNDWLIQKEVILDNF